MKAIERLKQRGQGMTEYIIIVALIAIAAIGVYNLFGKTLRNQVAATAEGLAGNATMANQNTKKAGDAAKGATAISNEARGLQNFANDVGSK
ncbi:MAG: pilus assembly protein [Burkholderiaceae bacterium]|nr:pilus assembly protein [Burkholderiaceae bacterium]